MKNLILKVYWTMFLRAAQDQKSVELARLASIKLVKLGKKQLLVTKLIHIFRYQ